MRSSEASKFVKHCKMTITGTLLVVALGSGAAALYRARKRSDQSATPLVEVIEQALSYSIIKIGDRELRFQLTLPPDTIEPLFSGAAWAGTVVWPASVFLANHLKNENQCSGRTVLELGAGVGVPGIASGILGASRVILTEQPPLSDLLLRNIKELFPNDTTSRFQVATLDWTEPLPESIGQVDLILISDCIYEGLYGESWRALANVLNMLLTEKNRALNCVERRKEDGIDQFIQLCDTQYRIKSTLIQNSISSERITELYEMKRY